MTSYFISLLLLYLEHRRLVASNPREDEVPKDKTSEDADNNRPGDSNDYTNTAKVVVSMLKKYIEAPVIEPHLTVSMPPPHPHNGILLHLLHTGCFVMAGSTFEGKTYGRVVCS